MNDELKDKLLTICRSCVLKESGEEAVTLRGSCNV
jgi:hypothetical protein